MKQLRSRRSIRSQLISMFLLLLITFAVILSLLFNGILQRQLISNYNASMQRHAYAISQNLSELIAPSGDQMLDETRFIVSEDTLAPYLALIEQITSCNVYVVDTAHDITGYFDGVVQRLDNPLLPGYIEQTIALGFMGKTPAIRAYAEGDIHLTACMPIMDENSRVLGVVLLESTLRQMGYSQVPSAVILLTSIVVSFVLSGILAGLFTRQFTLPIRAVQRFAHELAGGNYALRMEPKKQDEIGSLAQSMDILAQRLEDARARDEQLRSQQRAFFANVSHELKTPVTVIRGSLEALSDGIISSPEDRQAYYQQMIVESRWLQRLIQDLLELSRLQNLEFSLEKSTFSLSELLGDVAMSAGALCEAKGILFEAREPSRDMQINGDYARLRQMLLAVVDNAVKYTPQGRRVRLSVSEEEPLIVIADEGKGIAQQELEHIFERFARTRDASRESTGLGLPIVKEIARRHDIAISVMSSEGQGTTVTFRLPQGEETAADADK
ncbi:MAG: HAMP domain-containing histidine kinase [Clostridia bacterium]|nr:HAMP domain-containing histidine kinase [Clostridia bacterium]